MAYAAVASLSETIDIILKYHQDYTTPEFRNQIISLQKHSVFLQSFIEDDPNRANNWDETIREVTDRAEEIVELSLSDSWLESKSSVGSSKSKSEYGSDELERVIKEMEESVVNRLKGGRRMEAMDVYDHDLMHIISRLREGSFAREIIAIVGMGGTGKTTLARNAYNHPSIIDHYDIRAWSVMSQEYSRRGIILELLRSMKAEVRKLYSEDELIERLYRNLYNKRYLIVVDDIWDAEAWDSLRFMFPDNGNESRIILTSRMASVASYASYFHHMRLLDEDASWRVCREKIFKGDPCPSQLEPIGRMIAKSCRGHTLSIAVVSGILAAADQTEAAWKDILEDIPSNIACENDELGLDILSLSYTYLPHHLRPCFLYLGLFPEDHEIHVSKLIKLWVAEGFLNQSEYKSYEEMGKEHVEDLVRRSLVSVTKRKSNGRIKSITVHDLMRDLCLRQAQIDNFMLHVGGYYRQHKSVELQSYRRVSTFTCNEDFLKGVYGSTIRTIMLTLKINQVGVISWSIENVRLLRILDLSKGNNYDFVEELFELFHLRYLAFHSGFSVSEAILNLQNLQTLIIIDREDDDKIGNLPEGIWGMSQLRHLDLCRFPFDLPSREGATSALENLQTLSGVVDLICSQENLKMMPNLKKLCMPYSNKKSRNVVLEDYELNNLIYLHKLEILNIASFEEEHKMITQCAFPLTLKKLSLFGKQIPWKDMNIVASLPNLQVLKLRNHACIGDTWETSEGGFPQLTYLLIEESMLKNWITKSSRHFPRLKCLVLGRSLRLLEVPNGIGRIPTLELIELDDQEDHSLLRSANQIQEDRQSLGYGFLQIRRVSRTINVDG